MQVEVDEETLKEIAKRTGGEYFRATDADRLEEVYREIDRLERTKITEERSREYREYFDWPLALGLVLASIGWLGRGALFRRLP
jgi:Ca-activated chloride channel family protein